jgi:hypothetical protein
MFAEEGTNEGESPKRLWGGNELVEVDVVKVASGHVRINPVGVMLKPYLFKVNIYQSPSNIQPV